MHVKIWAYLRLNKKKLVFSTESKESTLKIKTNRNY